MIVNRYIIEVELSNLKSESNTSKAWRIHEESCCQVNGDGAAVPTRTEAEVVV